MQKNNKTLILILAVILTAGMFIQGCRNGIGSEQASILKRIPDSKMVVVSFTPKDILNSEFVTKMLDLEDIVDRYEDKNDEFLEKTGVDLRQDVDRVTLFAGDFVDRIENAGIILQGDFKSAKIDSLVNHDDTEFENIKIGNYDILKSLRHRTNRGDENVYLYHSNREVLITSTESGMETLLNLKDGIGRSLADNKEFLEKLKKLDNVTDQWLWVPTEQLIDDVFEKVRERNPRFAGTRFEIQDIIGGVTLNGDFKINYHAYNPVPEQLDLIHDLINGVRGMAMLATLDFPELRDIVKKVKYNIKDGYLDISAEITFEDIETIKEFESSFFRGR